MNKLIGMKYPFSVNGKGGISLVEQSKEDATIFNDKIEQLLNTGRGERTMECEIATDLDTFVFEPNDASTRTLLEYEVRQSILKHIPEITVTSVSITSVKNFIYAIITYTVDIYGTSETTTVKVGDLS